MGAPSARQASASALDLARARSDLGAFWALCADRALAAAEELDRSPAGAAPLRGTPFAVKDNFDLAGLPTTGGLQGEHPAATEDAEAVKRLITAGAIPIGKTAMDTLAWSTHGQAEGFPPCVNPRWPELSPGGSSSGSAVAVAAGVVPLALCSDTAGSARIPAAYCGVVGVKLGLGAAPLEGCLPLARSFDSVGVLGASVQTCATACGALRGAPVEEAIDGPVGVLTDLFDESDPGVARLCQGAVDQLARNGLEPEPVTLRWQAPGLGLLLATEFAAAWAQLPSSEPARFPPDILAAIDRAQQIDPERVRSVREQHAAARAELEHRFERFAALVCPTVPTTVPTVEQENVATSTRFTRIFSALGWPAASIPCGRDRDSHPVALHVTSVRGLGPVLALAAMIEAAAWP